MITVLRYLTKHLGRAGVTRPWGNLAKIKPALLPSPRQLSLDWVRRPVKRTIEAQSRLNALRMASPELTIAMDLVDEFTSLISKQSTDTLEECLSRAEVRACLKSRNFAEGIRRDESAINAAITTQ